MPKCVQCMHGFLIVLHFVCLLSTGAQENSVQRSNPSSDTKSKVSILAFDENTGYMDDPIHGGRSKEVSMVDDQGSSVGFRQRSQGRRQYRSVKK